MYGLQFDRGIRSALNIVLSAYCVCVCKGGITVLIIRARECNPGAVGMCAWNTGCGYATYISTPQLSWCRQVFPEPLPLLSDAFAQGLDSLPLARHVGGVEGQRDGLGMLIELRQVGVTLFLCDQVVETTCVQETKLMSDC